MGTTLNLRLFRKANKLTQDAVADYLGVTKGFISQVETGKAALPEDKLQKLLDNPQWSVDEYKRMSASFLAISVTKPEDPVPVAVGDGDVLYRVPLLPIFAQAGHRTTAIYIKRDQRKVDEANRKVIDYIKGAVPHLTTQDG